MSEFEKIIHGAKLRTHATKMSHKELLDTVVALYEKYTAPRITTLEAENERLAEVMMKHGLATGHGSTMSDLIHTLDEELQDRYTKLQEQVNVYRDALIGCLQIACDWDEEPNHKKLLGEIADRASRALDQNNRETDTKVLILNKEWVCMVRDDTEVKE